MRLLALLVLSCLTCSCASTPREDASEDIANREVATTSKSNICRVTNPLKGKAGVPYAFCSLGETFVNECEPCSCSGTRKGEKTQFQGVAIPASEYREIQSHTERDVFVDDAGNALPGQPGVVMGFASRCGS